jgi:hypothetical protein
MLVTGGMGFSITNDYTFRIKYFLAARPYFFANFAQKHHKTAQFCPDSGGSIHSKSNAKALPDSCRSFRTSICIFTPHENPKETNNLLLIFLSPSFSLDAL